MPFTLIAVAALASAQSTKIQWEGYSWFVKSTLSEGPGPCRWSPKNVWIDAKGSLHLKIGQVDGHWCCAEIWTDKPLPFGEYQCQVEGPIDKLDQNVVFSMFSYAGPDGVKETDIEYARWGNPKYPNGNWTVYPEDKMGKITQKTFEFKLEGAFTTSRFFWEPMGITYWLLGGFQPLSSEKNVIQKWKDTTSDSLHDFTQEPIPLHFNLWLFRGHPPTDGKPVEIIVHKFEWAPEK